MIKAYFKITIVHHIAQTKSTQAITELVTIVAVSNVVSNQFFSKKYHSYRRM